MFLYDQHCEASTIPTLLSTEQAKSYLKEIPTWNANLEKKGISRTFKFENYHQTLLFINSIAKIIHTENHHPNISFGYNYCLINYSTHSDDGVTLFDFICAAKIERIFSTKDN